MNSKRARLRDVSLFVSDMAEVREEEDEDEELDEEEEEILDDADGSSEEDGHVTDIPLRSFSQRLEEDAREFADWSEEIGRLAKERAGREHALRSQLLQAEKPGPLSSIIDLPDVNDPIVFSVRVKPGKATSLTFALMRKVLADTKNRYTQIKSVFSVPTISNRIYVESLGHKSVDTLCKNMYSIYNDSWHPVSVVERVAILEGRVRPVPDTGLCVNSIVKIRSGRYRDDLGLVVGVPQSKKRFVVKLKSREDMPGDLKRKKGRCRNAAFLLTKKIARDLGTKSVLPGRPDISAKTTFEDLRSTDSDCESETDPHRASFRFNGKTYSPDGHILLKLAMDQVERVDTADSSVDNELFLATNPVVPYSINEGHEVWITDGEAAGSCGLVIQLNPSDSALVSIQESGSSKSRPDTLLELNKRHLVRKFNIGDKVEVKIGIYVGVKGIIGKIDTRRGYKDYVLGIVELNDDLPEDREVLVPNQFVDIIDDLADSYPCVRDEFVEGQHVIVAKGKLQGKTGIVALVEKHHSSR
ncbi:hypothetical protein SCHPADRAFT_947564 [Schizopora paradoxa]|uniref:Chromatin elongation factor SPT5 n=1 Tax=Schizopora paradoxa TaxID=27342 RepID=A0A0H2RIE7_9AGAM|nr:hypothetical protein SCHPADRAFT_947564 [Schizopora paradoxa]